MLKIYNSLTKQKQEFKPITSGKVGIYVCGMTVYDYCHIGHARVMVAFDVITRYLRHLGYAVNHVRNITDIDDKIINRANENKEDIDKLTERFIKAMNEDFKKLDILPPEKEPKATLHIKEIINMIEVLIENKVAYIADNGDVYYDVASFKNYGQLAHKDIEGLQAGARVDIVEDKRNPLDFVLWKLAKPKEPSWDSPWGKGRPGWHIECSAMSTQCLGDTFDIHGGGFDLQFPHHENEIAQSEAATNKKFVNTWMHVGFVQVNREKMSKSLGNFFTIREVLEKYRPEVIRYFLIASHYRSQVNYSTENLDDAQQALERFYTSMRDLPNAPPLEKSEYEKRFNTAMDDDFNTALAMAVLFDMTHEINSIRNKDIHKAGQIGALLKQLGGILGLLQHEPVTFLHADITQDIVKKVEGLIAKRNEARLKNDWAKADQIRDELHDMGIELEDGSEGSVWRKIQS